MEFPYQISVVVCIYNEENNIALLTEQIRQALSGLSFEIVYVDDCSTDASLGIMRSLASGEVKVVELRKNYGQSLALDAGIQQAAGKYIVTMDGDLQNDPADIPKMLEKLEAGDYDVVAGVRKNRQDGLFLRKIPSKIAGYIIRKSLGVTTQDFGCTLRIFRHEIAKELNLYGEQHRFISVQALLNGARVAEIDVNHRPRIHGKSKYGLGRTIRVISDLFLILFFKQYLLRPMHLFGGVGFILTFIGVVINIYLLVLKIMGQDIWGRPLILVGILCILAGIQLITLGIFLELQMRTYYESQDKRPYRVRKVHS
jgi:glycosyltransferase involved in cell wall biosynthesis